MNNTLNLDLIIRKADATPNLVPGEEKLVTIDLTSCRSIEKTFLVRFGGFFQDYVVANNHNPLRTINAKMPVHYVRDGDNKRTLAIDITLEAIGCPAGNEAKVAEALHGQQAPGQNFAGLIQRWVREIIVPGDEARFIDSFDAARHQLERHLAARAAAHAGLELTDRITLAGETAVAREIVVGPIEIGVRLHGYTEEQKLTVEAGLALDPHNYVNAFVFNEKLDSTEELFKRKLKDYFFHHVTFDQFTYRLLYPNFKQSVLQALSLSLREVGRVVRFINFSTTASGVHQPPREFVRIEYNYSHTIPGRQQPVIIQNTLQLYCEDSVAFLASRISDLEKWARQTLSVSLSIHLIGKSYVDLLLRFADTEAKVKRDVSAAAGSIGYRVDHLVSVPNLEHEKDELMNPFVLEAKDTFETSLERFEVELQFTLRVCMPKLDSIEKYLNPGSDVKEAIRQTILGEARYWLRKIHPERFYLYFNEDNKGASLSAGEDERLPVKELLNKKIQESLKKEFNARIFDLTQRIGRSDLRDRYHDLCFVIRKFKVAIDSPDPKATEDLTLTGDFELRGVHSDENGWRRFSSLRLDLDGLQEQLETHLRSELKTYYQASFMYRNQVSRQQVFNIVSSRAETYMRQEFGLIIHLTNLDRNTTKVEEDHRQFLIELENDKLRSEKEHGKLLITRLNELKKTRVKELSIFPIDKKMVAQIDDNIQFLEGELAKLTSRTFGQHPVGATLETQQPDLLPPVEDTQPTDQAKLRPVPKAQLAG